MPVLRSATFFRAKALPLPELSTKTPSKCNCIRTLLFAFFKAVARYGVAPCHYVAAITASVDRDLYFPIGTEQYDVTLRSDLNGIRFFSGRQRQHLFEGHFQRALFRPPIARDRFAHAESDRTPLS